MIQCGLKIEAQHHEVATGGQGEIDMKFAPLVEMADNVLKYKYIIKNVAKKHGKSATFMPKPLFQDNGSGMHVHASLWKGGTNLYAGSGYAGLSDMGMYAIGGLLKHAPALCAITNPTTNSYKRWCRVMKRPSILPIAAAIARLPSAFPFIRQARRPSALNSAARTARAIPTWYSPRC